MTECGPDGLVDIYCDSYTQRQVDFPSEIIEGRSDLARIIAAIEFGFPIRSNTPQTRHAACAAPVAGMSASAANAVITLTNLYFERDYEANVVNSSTGARSVRNELIG
jgi:hypothetical protein